MSEKVWKYWEEPDYPKHDNCCDGWNGVNSDPDHCVTRCEMTREYLIARIKKLESTRPTPPDLREAALRKAAERAAQQACVTAKQARDGRMCADHGVGPCWSCELRAALQPQEQK